MAAGRRGELGIVLEEIVQPGDDVEAQRRMASRMIGRQGGGILPPGGAMPINRALAVGSIGQRGDDGQCAAHAQPLLAGLAGPLPVEHCDHVFGLVAKHVDGGLGGVGVVVAVGEDDQSASHGEG